MEAKDILLSMSKLPWVVGESIVNEHGVSCINIDAAKEDMVTGIITVNGVTDTIEPYSGSCDLHATITAVNNTYGKGLNPEVYEDVVTLLEGLLQYEEIAFGNKVMIKEVLKKARI